MNQSKIVIENGIMKSITQNGPFIREEIIGGAYTTCDIICKGEVIDKDKILADNSESPIVDNVGEFKVSAETDNFVNDLFTRSFEWYPNGNTWVNIDEVTWAWVDKSDDKYKILFGYVGRGKDDPFNIVTRPENLRERM